MAKRRSKKRGVAFTTDADVPRWGASKKAVKANQAERDRKNENAKIHAEILVLRDKVKHLSEMVARYHQARITPEQESLLRELLRMPAVVAIDNNLSLSLVTLHAVLRKHAEAAPRPDDLDVRLEWDAKSRTLVRNP